MLGFANKVDKSGSSFDSQNRWAVVALAVELGILSGCAHGPQLEHADNSALRALGLSSEPFKDRKYSNSLIELPLRQPSEGRLVVLRFEDFNPKIEQAYPSSEELGLMGLAMQRPRLNFKSSLLKGDPQQPRFSALANFLRDEYLPKHPELKQQLNIVDYANLDPQQALRLVVAICRERLNYSMLQLASSEEGKAEAKKNDSLTIEEIFRLGPDQDGNAVCRNYAVIACGVMEAIKCLQDPARNKLASTHILEVDWMSTDSKVPGNVINHAWNLVMCNTGQEVLVSIFDITWADTAVGEDPARGLFDSAKLDRSERLYTSTAYFEKKGFLNPHAVVAELLKSRSVSNGLSLNLIPIGQDSPEKTLQDVAIESRDNHRLAQLIAGNPTLLNSNDVKIWFRAYVLDLSNQIGLLEKIEQAASGTIVNAVYLPRLIKETQDLARTVELMPLDKKPNVQELEQALLKHFTKERIALLSERELIEILEVAEALRSRELSNQLFEEGLAARLRMASPPNSSLNESFSAFLKSLLPERRNEFLTKLPPATPRLTPAKESAVETDRVVTRELGVVFLTDRSVSAVQSSDMRNVFKGALKSLGNPFLGDMKIFINPEGHTPSVSPFSIGIQPSDNVKSVQKKLEFALWAQHELLSIRAASPCALQLSRTPFFSTEIHCREFLTNIRSFFCDPKNREILKFKEICLDWFDSMADGATLRLKVEHFENPEFSSDRIRKLLLSEKK